MTETKRTVLLKGKPMTLAGSEIKVGQKAPDFKLLAIDSTNVELSQSEGKVRLLSVVHSLDTNVCDLQTQRFEQETANFKDIIIYAISMDLPFAQKRWCGAAGVTRVQTLSDHRDASFGTAYGVLIKELRLLARAVFVVDRNGTIQHVQLVKEITREPDYDAVLAAVKRLM